MRTSGGGGGGGGGRCGEWIFWLNKVEHLSVASNLVL